MAKQKPVPSKTTEGREAQLIALAIDQAEQQLRDGTAPPSVLNFYLKLGSTREALEREKLEKENQLLRAKTDRLDAEAQMEDMYTKVLEAMQSYSPTRDPGVVIDDEEDF